MLFVCQQNSNEEHGFNCLKFYEDNSSTSLFWMKTTWCKKFFLHEHYSINFIKNVLVAWMISMERLAPAWIA